MKHRKDLEQCLHVVVTCGNYLINIVTVVFKDISNRLYEDKAECETRS